MQLVELGALCVAWQERLGLRDWRISVLPADVYAMGKENRAAHVEWDLCERVAQVQVMPADHPSLAAMLVRYDEEEGLVHELIHILLAGQEKPENDSQNTMLEQAINQLARALVGLKRAAEGKAEDAADGTGSDGTVRAGGEAELQAGLEGLAGPGA